MSAIKRFTQKDLYSVDNRTILKYLLKYDSSVLSRPFTLIFLAEARGISQISTILFTVVTDREIDIQ